MEKKDLNLLGIIALVGAIFMIIGVFINWTSIDAILTTLHQSGWDIYKDGLYDYSYAPLLVLICGILALLLMIVPTFVNVDKFKKINNILGIITLILSLICVIVVCLFYSKMSPAKADVGLWLALIGSIITLIGGVMPIVKNRVAKSA